MFTWLKNWRRSSRAARKWPDDWTNYLERNVRHFRRLDDDEQTKLKRLVQVMVAEKRWEGHDGLEISDEIKVTVSGAAAIMLLGVKDYYFDSVKTIILFPRPIRRKTQFGWVVDEDQYHAGEAWSNGPVVLSWHDVLVGARNEDDGQNLVVHEFAHKLDGIDGAMDGEIMFPDQATMEQWSAVVAREYQELCNAAQRNRRTLLDHYGATNLAEFFAVSSETFFERPDQMRRKHAELYKLLVKYYQVNPAKWL